MAESLKIGMVGLDTSHVSAFTQLLHDEAHPHHVAGGKVEVAFPGGSPDFPLSAQRVAGFTEELVSQHGVRLVDSVAAVAESSDAILLESVDGRVHLEQFEQLVGARKPVFVDKPFAVSLRDAKAMVDLAHRHGTPLFSCSPLRFAAPLTENLAAHSDPLLSFTAYGPMALEPTQPGLFWYGIHGVEMLYAAFGPGCTRVRAVSNADYDQIIGEWPDGRLGTVHGNRRGNSQFAAVLQRQSSVGLIDVSASPKPYYASLLEKIMQFFHTGVSPIPLEETVEIIEFIECANRSRETGEAIALGGRG